MRMLRQTLHLFGALVVLTIGGLQSSAAAPLTGIAAIHAVDDAWVKAFNSGDADSMAALYDEHAVLLPPNASAVRGRAAIRAFFAKMIASAGKDGLVFSLDPKPAGGVRGDLGWSSGTYVAKDKTRRVVETGKYLSVSKKKNGKWLYFRDTWNSDGQPSSAESTAPSTK